jgi:hypothetical protein
VAILAGKRGSLPFSKQVWRTLPGSLVPFFPLPNTLFYKSNYTRDISSSIISYPRFTNKLDKNFITISQNCLDCDEH